MAMDPIAHVIKAFSGEKPERVPVAPFLGGSWPIINAGTTIDRLIGHPAETAGIFYEINEALDSDLLLTGTGFAPLVVRALGGEIKFNAKGAPEITEELIKTEGDLEKLEVSRAIEDKALQWIRDSACELHKMTGGKRLLLASGRGPFTLAAQMLGLENISRGFYKNREFVHRLLDFTTRLTIEYFIPMLKEGYVQGVYIADPTASGTVISLKHYKEFVIPYLETLAAAVKESGGFSMLHICGDITDRLHVLPHIGIDAVSLDSKVNIARAREILANRVCIGGNVDPVEVMQFGSGEDVKKAAKECIRQGNERGGFILMPGCEFNARVPRENVESLVEAGHGCVFA